jgi:2,3-bisphosphoglycerate-independent phosphoglycerate mutase
MKKVILTVLDGVGISSQKKGNAFKQAHTPNIDYIMSNFPNSLLEASGLAVGLPKNQVGNSEVGHMSIGSGRLIEQDLIRINKSILEETFYQNKAFLKAINNCKENNTNIHLIGLVSDGGIHSHLDHLLALLDFCYMQNFKQVYIHALLDGRDTEPKVAKKYLKILEDKIKQIGIGEIITVGGRYYLMNRDSNYDLTQKAYNAIVDGEGPLANNIYEVIETSYKNNITDEFILPTVIKKVPIQANDSIIFFNYRSDRMLQFLSSISNSNFNFFPRKRFLTPLTFITMTKYDKNNNITVAFSEPYLNNTLGDYLSQLNKRQIRISESEKQPHVTYFFSGCTKKPFPLEDRLIFERENVFTYDESPAMRSASITDAIIESTKSNYDLIVANYPNGDALGHTGILEAAIKGVESIDQCIGKILKNIDLDKYIWIITSDHGNCEHMISDDNMPDKTHTNNKVPFIIVNKEYQLNNGSLVDIAPTILDIMNIKIPKEMTGTSLLKGETHV